MGPNIFVTGVQLGLVYLSFLEFFKVNFLVQEILRLLNH